MLELCSCISLLRQKEMILEQPSLVKSTPGVIIWPRSLEVLGVGT